MNEQMGERVNVKDKIKQLSKGHFEYEQPGIILSEDEIRFSLEVGKSYQGTFMIQNNSGTQMKGIVYSSNPNMKIQNAAFSGEINQIEYEFSSSMFTQGDEVVGVFSIISNCGEVELPFYIVIEAAYCMTSLGKMKDLFLFANLAKAEPVEAVNLFESDDFKRVFLSDDMKGELLYASLIKSDNSYHAMEEFLVAIHKKLPLQISINKTSLEYQVRNTSFMDKIVLTKDQWGYAKFLISTDTDFIQIEHSTLLAEQFIGNTFQLEYVINPAYMRDGINYGCIRIESTYQTLEITVKVYCNKGTVMKEEGHYKKRECILHLLQNYINFRTHKLDASVYVDESKATLSVLSSYARSRVIELIRVHLLMIEGQVMQVQNQIEVWDKESERIKDNSILEYCAYLYLKALFIGDSEYTKAVVNEINVYYHNGYKHWQILWLLLYLDKRYENNYLKLSAIREQLQMGCHSPIIYYEACAIYNDEPELLIDLDNEAILVMNWGIKTGLINQDAILRYVYLAGREKKFIPLIFRGLVTIYEQVPSKELLFAICSMLIKGHMIANKYFKWFELGVQEQLRITELHEHYMYSLDESQVTVLPQPILLYFVYNSTLSDRKKAFLYSNIIKHKEENAAIYHTYVKQIESYAYKQLAAHNINHNLAIIYEELISTIGMDELIAKYLPNILYEQEVKCNNKYMTGVYIQHKEMEEEEFIPLVEGCAQVSIFTENAKVYFVDSENNRYYETIPYSISKFISLDNTELSCYEIYPDNKMLLLSMFDKIENYQKYDHNSTHIKRQILEIHNLRMQYKRRTFTSLLQYYYDNNEESSLDELLMKASMYPVYVSDCGKIIEYCILRDLYEYAIYYMKTWGFDKVPLNRLQKLCNRMIRNAQDEKDEFLLEISHYLFTSEKRDEGIISYLAKFYVGTNTEMYDIWKAGKEFDINCTQLEERLLGQLLFTENNLQYANKVFLSYYEHAGNPLLVRGFLTYTAFKYLLNDRVLEQEVFDLFKKESVYEENETTMLALLKYYSQEQNLTEEEIAFIDYNLHKFIDKGIILPFYQAFKDRITIPFGIAKQYYVEYISDPKNIVKIHYRIEQENGEDDFITEVMTNMYYGIHIKGFLLFYNQVLQYYITEEYEGEETITESFHLKMESKVDDKCENKYGLINLMLMAREMKDEKTLLELMKQYIKTEYAENNLFKPL